MDNRLKTIVTIKHSDGIRYYLKTDGNIYFRDESNNYIKLENYEKEKEIRNYFKPPKTDIM